MGFDIKNKTAKFYADGNTILATMSMSDIGKYTAESLKLEESRNATIRVAGSRFSLSEILEKFEESTGESFAICCLFLSLKNTCVNYVNLHLRF